MLSGEKVSSEDSSSSLVTHTLSNNPMCTCGSPASLRTSNTPRNPGRSFFGCSKYNSQGLPHCNYFKWADSDSCHEREKELVKLKIEMLRKEEELHLAQVEAQQIAKEVRRREEEVQRREEDVRRREEEVRSWMVEVRKVLEEVRKIDGEIVKSDLGVQPQCTNIKLWCIIFILLYLYFSLSQ
ncbi:golgin subfamily A member 6-like protein 6 [Carya illinoinensis]|uniref:golgin subfamily A member 6-like protein 6 n=1 Tax=Carya illinoinensis TaxID=32201 RepID=UPI001C727C00|nr:golgin subfamily A member 6-like protein 6 [Carya illinoinensis]